MKIKNVTPLVLGTAWRNLVFVKVETDEGRVGVGEARALNRLDAILGYLQLAVPRYVVGSDPFDIESLLHRMWRDDYARMGETALTGCALIEIARWDIMGQAVNQPVYRLLGGAVRDKIKAYGNGWYTVERTPEEFHAAARRVVERGYQALKFDPFGNASGELEPAELRRSVALGEP